MRYGGVPAKLIRKRFEDETITKLLESQWWTKDEVELNEIQGDIEKVLSLKDTDR